MEERYRHDKSNRNRELFERRKQKDLITKAIPIFGVIAWVGAMVALLFLDTAKPLREDFFSRLFNSPVISSWNTSLLRWVLAILIMVFVICVAGFFCNMIRHKRKTDKYSKAILIMAGISLIFIAVFCINFADLLW